MRRQKQVEAATHDLSATLQRAPTEAEVAEKVGVDVDRFRTMMIDLRNRGPFPPRRGRIRTKTSRLRIFRQNLKRTRIRYARMRNFAASSGKP